ncbi:hypothetical protein FQA39_LY12972 [Lamprigera yunnana]|nr:hypothetical protein FQA39_LY12972 [Lamprigera yunnana]
MKNHINSKDMYDVIIIGGGPAGMTSGVYTARAGIKTLIIEKDAPGGKMVKTEEIENYPGFEKILGPDLSMKMFSQVTSLGAEFEYGEVVDVKVLEDKTFEVILANQQKNELGIPGEQKLYGKGVSYCAVCDGAFHKQKPVAVVGGGYSAVQEAMYLTQFASMVYVIVRKNYFRADDLKVEKLRNKPNVTFLMETVTQEVLGESKVEAITIKDSKTGEVKKLEVTAIFPYIGSTPITGFIKNLNVGGTGGYIDGNPKMETNIEGLYVAGDVRDVPLRQIAIAAGDGAMAGQMAVEYVQNVK